MPTTIAIESKNVTVFGVETSYQHLYLVKTVTGAGGRVVDERVIRGDVGSDLTLVTQANIPLASSPDARGSATPAQRNRTVLDLDGRDPDAVWNVMVQHVAAIDKADLPYGTGVGDGGRALEVNSNTTVASALHAVGIDLARTLPAGITPARVPLYDRVEFVLVDDVLTGSDLDDVILGGVGNDTLDGRGGNDRLFGEAGNDRLVGGSGNDILEGGAGADRMTGAAGNDRYRVDAAGDVVIESDLGAAGGYDHVIGAVSVRLSSDRAGVERLTLTSTRDLNGTGNALANWMTGNAGDNALLGGSGNDALRAGSGNDRLVGGSGADLLVGGTGRDTYLFKNAFDSGPGAEARDVIAFLGGSDVIDLSGIDAQPGAAGDQAFTWIGAGAFTGAGQLRVQSDPSGSTLVQANVDGDLAADFEVLVRASAAPITAADFVL